MAKSVNNKEINEHADADEKQNIIKEGSYMELLSSFIKN